MTTFVALLRAVNVGGTAKLPMEALRGICAQAGFTDVRTYIQSGNVIFDTHLPPEAARAELETRLLGHLGKAVGVILRTAGQMREVLARNPFPGIEPDRIHVLFLEQAPPPDAAITLKGQVDEQIVAGEREIFIFYPSGMGRSRLRLPAMQDGTARNLNTVAKLVEIVSGRD